jgi:hypothetical protein
MIDDLWAAIFAYCKPCRALMLVCKAWYRAIVQKNIIKWANEASMSIDMARLGPLIKYRGP